LMRRRRATKNRPAPAPSRTIAPPAYRPVCAPVTGSAGAVLELDGVGLPPPPPPPPEDGLGDGLGLHVPCSLTVPLCGLLGSGQLSTHLAVKLSVAFVLSPGMPVWSNLRVAPPLIFLPSRPVLAGFTSVRVTSQIPLRSLLLLISQWIV